MDIITPIKPHTEELGRLVAAQGAYYAPDWSARLAAAASWGWEYVRKSKTRNKADTLAVERQLEGLVPFRAERLGGAAVVLLLVDNDVTAYNEFAGRDWARELVLGVRAKPKERVAFGLLLDALRERGPTCAGGVTLWQDRMFRDLLDFVTFCGLTDGKIPGRPAIPVYSPLDGFIDLSTANGRTMAGLKVVMAQGEVDKQQERASLEKPQRRSRGVPPGGRWGGQFGYERPAPRVYRPVEAEAEVIREGARMVLARRQPLIAVARYWDAEGHRTRSGGRFSVSAVGRVLTSPTIAGMQPPCRSDPEWRPGHWPPILTLETVQAIERELAERRAASDWGLGPGGRGPAPKYLLTGKLVCGVCGSRRVHAQGRRDRRAYTCIAGYTDRPDLAKGSRAHLGRLVHGVDAYVCGHVLAVLELAPAEVLTDRGDDLATLRAEVAAQEARYDKWCADVASWEDDPATFHAERLARAAARDVARAALALALGPASPLAAFAGQDRAGIERVWDAGDMSDWRSYVDALIDHIVLPRGGRGRPKGNGTGLPRGKGTYLKAPPVIHWRAEYAPYAPDSPGHEDSRDPGAAGRHGRDR